MAGESFDDLIPFIPIFWRSYVLFVPEGMQRAGIGGELFGHEADFDEGANFIFEKAIVDLVDIGKIVDGFAGRIFVVDANFILKDGVEPDVIEICDSLGLAQVMAIAVAERKNGATGAEHFFPEMRQGAGWCGGIDLDGFGMYR